MQEWSIIPKTSRGDMVMITLRKFFRQKLFWVVLGIGITCSGGCGDSPTSSSFGDTGIGLTPGSAKVMAKDQRIPIRYWLGQNFPNPFNSETVIMFQLHSFAYISLSVYDLSGQRIRTLMESAHPAGTYSVVWDGTDDTGRDVASGVYLCRMVAGEYSAVRKLVLIR